MTAQQLTDQMISDTRHRLDTAAIIGALASGELVRTPYERLLILSSRYKAHKAAGRVRAAAAVKRMADRLIPLVYGE
jgi:hypothetical protein